MPDAQCPMPDAQCPMPNARCPMSNARCPMPNARCQIVPHVTEKGYSCVLQCLPIYREYFESFV